MTEWIIYYKDSAKNWSSDYIGYVRSGTTQATRALDNVLRRVEGSEAEAKKIAQKLNEEWKSRFEEYDHN